MIKNLYKRYLLVDRLNKIADKAGVSVHKAEIAAISTDVHFQVGMPGLHTPASNEEAAVRLLDAMPDLKIVRSDGLITLTGTTGTLMFQFYCGRGVCDRVLVGTRTVPATPEHEEPVYEIRCSDPLAAMADA